MHHQWLCITPLMNLIPLYYYLRYSKEHTRSLTFIHFFIICLMISTIVFWYSPIRNGWAHKIDKTIVHFIGFLAVGYVLFYKLFSQKISRYIWFLYGMVLSGSSYFLYLSNYYSTIEWCSRDHIVSHFWFHLFAKPSIWFLFV